MPRTVSTLKRADARNLDPDRSIVGDGRVVGAFLQVERLVDRAVDIDEEVRAELPLRQVLEALAAVSNPVVVEDDLVDDCAKRIEVAGGNGAAVGRSAGAVALGRA
jgi:hypothetical protein